MWFPMMAYLAVSSFVPLTYCRHQLSDEEMHKFMGNHRQTSSDHAACRVQLLGQPNILRVH